MSNPHLLEAKDHEKTGKSFGIVRRHHIFITTRRRLSVVGRVLRKFLENRIEARGIERVLEDERDSAHIWNKQVIPYLPA